MQPVIRIIHLYPDLLNLYGDMGNIIALRQRAERRGLETEVLNVSLGDTIRPEDFDILLIGGGQDSQQKTVQQDLITTKKGALGEAADQGKVILAICGGYQLLGKSVSLPSGAVMDGLGILDIITKPGEGRLIGDTMYQANFLAPDLSGPADQPADPRLLIGFENHGARTYLGESMKPLARVLRGKGNNSEDQTEGVHWKNVFGTYSHGSFLPKNPAMTDYLLQQAIRNRTGEDYTLPKLAAPAETEARRQLWERLKEA